MKLRYSLLLAAAFAVVAWPRTAAAQQEFTECPDDQDVCLVEWRSGDDLIVNALRNTIIQDAENGGRPEGRIYKLLRGGFYWNADRITNDNWHLRIVGQTPAEADTDAQQELCGLADCGMPVIQRVRRSDGSVDALMIEANGDGSGGFTLENLWLQGQDETGVTANYEPITINSSNSRFVIDNVIFDRNDWHHLGFKSAGNEIYIRNSSFRNLADPTQIWSGRGIRLEAGADTLMFENNSFFNLTSFPVQSEAAPIEYFLFNHNTLVNFGRNFNAGGIWKKAYIANNLMVNPFWQGESAAQFEERLETWVAEGNDPEDLDPYIGTFNIAPLPSEYGLEADRRILLANNNHYRDDALNPYYEELGITAQPLVSDSTASFFAIYDGMQMQNNLDLNPMLANAPTTPGVYEQMGLFLEQWVEGAPTPWEHIFWDPGRDTTNYAAVNWPVPEDFSYTNETLLNAGTDDLPLGDLNWFPDALETYWANRAEYIEELEDMAGPEVEEPVATNVEQAENAISIESGEVQAVEGFTSFRLESGGSINWTFEVPEDGTYGLNVMTNMGTETTRGQHIRVDEVGLTNSTNYGEYFFCSTTATADDCPPPNDEALEPDTWETVEIRANDLVANAVGALDLAAGTHTLQIAPSWGYQDFSTVTVVDAAGEVVATLTPPDAVVNGGVIENCEEAEYCPRGFQWVDLTGGGSFTWSVDVPENVNSAIVRLFYLSDGGTAATIAVDGEEATTLSLPPATADAPGEVASSRIALTSGTHEVTVSSTNDASFDYGIFILYEGMASSTDERGLPEGYSLQQNFPNPFGENTTIRYELAEASPVTLSVFDVLGRKVATLVDGFEAAGPHSVRFDSDALSSGTYFYRIETAVGQQVRKMVVVR